MRTIYVDNNGVCHGYQAEGYTSVETDSMFEGKSDRYIESFKCELDTVHIFPTSPIKTLEAIQSSYEDGQRNILTEVEGVLGL